MREYEKKLEDCRSRGRNTHHPKTTRESWTGRSLSPRGRVCGATNRREASKPPRGLLIPSLLRMLLLHCSQKLAMLEKALMKSFPESLKVYGSIYRINRGNPFNLEVVVDTWPNFNTVVSRPHESEMKDDLDNYTNSYFMFTKDPENLREMLTNTDVVNWKQVLQIQGFQSSVDKVLKDVSVSKMVKMDIAKNTLFTMEKTVEPSDTNKGDFATEIKDGSTTAPLLQGSDGKIYQLAPLSECYADRVNQGWAFGGNEHSLRYIQRCILHFPSFGVMDSDGNPVSWAVTEQSLEYRMGFTLPERRNTGIIKQLLSLITQPPFRILEHGPVYCHITEDNDASIRATMGAGFHIAPGNWYQWTCRPVRSPL
ncbi:glycine N-acyltransferase-like protein 2 isoform X1 [Rhinatrema bivittatum]|uniref:glycine N-acyltransferase-like protein 2 isoform X1 n=2 Tax=Rhinatrema bivittatum TaxID=194408 RepID=UPI00112D6336|nr:glycine N-acyltransferase-like protein 2 isoform X1 [Rhinatrema bivittatum]